MSASEFLTIIGVILVGLLFFAIARNYIFGEGEKTREYGYKAEAQEIIALIEKVAGEPNEFTMYCQDISLCDIGVKGGILTYEKDDFQYSHPIPKTVEEIKMVEVARICVINKNRTVTLHGGSVTCIIDTICTSEECLEDCLDCYGPEDICIGDGYCNPYIGEDCTNSIDCECDPEKVCCPESFDADENGCSEVKDLIEGDECWCTEQCENDLMCNPTTRDFSDYGKACCPPGQMYDGNECVLGGDVLIVALKSNLQSEYSDSQISTLENKIYDFIESLGTDGLGGMFLYLDEDETSDIIGSKVTSPSDWNNIDGILDQLIPRLESKYLIIIGGYDRFPQAEISTGACPDPYYSSFQTDDDYADYNPKDHVPEIPVGRIPDPNNGDLNVILNSLSTYISIHNSGGLDLSDYISISMSRAWPDYGCPCASSGTCFNENALGISCFSDPNCYDESSSFNSISGRNFVHILMHGGNSAPQRFVHDPCGGSFSMSSNNIPSLDVENSLWMMMPCYSSYIRNKDRTSDSIPMQILVNGGAIYMGGTLTQLGGTYDCNNCPSNGDYYIGSLYQFVVENFGINKRIGDSYLEGKKKYSSGLVPDPYSCNFRQAHENQIYGDPTLKIKKM